MLGPCTSRGLPLPPQPHLEACLLCLLMSLLCFPRALQDLCCPGVWPGSLHQDQELRVRKLGVGRQR